MGKNLRGGKKGRGKKNVSKESKELVTKIDGESEYGKVTKVNGNGRFTILNIDGIERMGIIRGTMRKKVWINNGDLVLTGIWDFQNDKCSIIHKYSEEDTEKIIKSNVLPPNFLCNDITNDNDFTDNPFDINSSDSDDDLLTDKSSLDESEGISDKAKLDENGVDIDEI